MNKGNYQNPLTSSIYGPKVLANLPNYNGIFSAKQIRSCNGNIMSMLGIYWRCTYMEYDYVYVCIYIIYIHCIDVCIYIYIYIESSKTLSESQLSYLRGVTYSMFIVLYRVSQHSSSMVAIQTSPVNGGLSSGTSSTNGSFSIAT